MGSSRHILLVTLAVIYTTLASTYEPMVAFVCNKGAMHMDPDMGWTSDPFTDCMESKQAILNYCNRTYPSLDITNIVETSDHMIIKGWCPLDQPHCQEETFEVRPYRCLTGPFQSDALIVPKGCIFDHIHDAAQCQSYDWWADVAGKACTNLHSMSGRSHAMLLPCGTDVFTGVEFVCCPEEGTEVKEETADSDTIVSIPTIEVKVKVPDVAPTDATEESEDDVLNKYLRMTSQVEYDDEHAAFELAKERLMKINHDKITKLMKEWAEARERVFDLKATDPKGAEALNSEITNRYQAEYFSVQTDSDRRTLQLDATHQQHVQSNLNVKKRAAMQKLMEELQSEFYDSDDILQYLKRYISVEEKDAQHCLKHFMKIHERDESAAQQMLPATIEHLTLINTRILQSIDLLDTLEEDKVAEKLKTSVKAWVSGTFTEINQVIARINDLQKATLTKDSSSTTEAPEARPVQYKIYAEKFSETARLLAENEPEYIDIAPLAEEEEKEDERAVDLAAYFERRMDAEERAPMVASDPASRLSAGVSLAIASTVLVALMVTLFAVMIVKKRRRGKGRPSSNHYLEVNIESSDLSPEDRHIAAMQSGYENPTYKLLESRKI